MNAIDLFTNVVGLLVLTLLAALARFAFDQRMFGRVAFCVALGLLIVRILAVRWLTGTTQSGISQNCAMAAFLSSAGVFLFTSTMFLTSLIWFTVEEYKEFREQRRIKKFAEQQLTTIHDKDIEIDRLHQEANQNDAATSAPIAEELPTRRPTGWRSFDWRRRGPGSGAGPDEIDSNSMQFYRHDDGGFYGS